MDDKEICKEQVCACLYDVLIKGSESEECVINPDNEFIIIQGSPEDYYGSNEEGNMERLAILSLNEKDSFRIGKKIHTKVLRIVYGNKRVFNTKGLERFDMAIYLVKYEHCSYLDFGIYEIYHKGNLLRTYECPPSIIWISHDYGAISDVNWRLIAMLNRLTKRYKKINYHIYGINDKNPQSR